MNILLFVTSLLMLLSLMTYARIDSFRYFLGMEAQFEKYMTSIERNQTNAAAEQWYDTTRATKPKDPNKPAKTPAPQNQQNQKKSSSRLSFRFFIDQKMRETNQAAFKQTAEWAKKLMLTLYGNQEFFAEEFKKNPAFMDEILESLERATEGLFTGKIKLTKAAQLSNLNLDESVREAFYHMLKGCPNSELKKNQALLDEKKAENNITSPSDAEGDEGDADDTANEAQEYSKDGYDSLLNYITLQNTPRIRVFLASRPLLAAIFGQVSTADAIIEARQGLYRAVIHGTLTPKDATDQFADQLKNYTNNFDEAFLDFTVSRTNPARYR